SLRPPTFDPPRSRLSNGAFRRGCHTRSMDDDPRDSWRDEYERAPLRPVAFETMSGIPVDDVYGEPPYPGQFPYTRGPYASMYRSKLWTMRMFAGFGTAADTNERFRAPLGAGAPGLSTAFDL